MICPVFCCTFMNHCNPDSSTKTHISSHTKHVFFNNSSLHKTHISSHPEHVFFHKGSHILSPKHAIFQRLFHRKFTYLPTITPSFKDPSTEYSHIISHKACLFNNSSLQKSHSSSHRKHVFLHAFDHKGSHILSPTPCPFSMALPHKIQFTYVHTQTMPSFKRSSTDNSHIFPHKPCLVSKTLPQKIHISPHPTHVFLHVFVQ